MKRILQATLTFLFGIISFNGHSQSREEVFASIQKILNRANGEKIKTFTGEERLIKQVFTPNEVSCYTKNLEYKSNWVKRYTGIPWNDLSEHGIHNQTGDGKIEVVILQFKKYFKIEDFTTDATEDVLPNSHNRMELYALEKDKADLNKYLELLYSFKEKEAKSAINSQISNTNSTQSSAIFQDGFSTNSNKWLEGENGSYKFKVSEGKYLLQAKAGGYWISTRPISFRTDQDFEISARIKKTAGTNGFYFGLVLGYDPSTTHHHFAGITGQGNVVFANKGTAPADLIPGNIYDVVNKGDASNLITIKKSRNVIRMYINTQYVGEANYQSLYGNYFGFQLWAGNENLTLEVDDLPLNQYNKAAYCSYFSPRGVFMTKPG
jgi:hypothetical protein